MGLLADRRTGVCLVLPRRAARPRVGEHRVGPVGEDEFGGGAVPGVVSSFPGSAWECDAWQALPAGGPNGGCTFAGARGGALRVRRGGRTQAEPGYEDMDYLTAAAGFGRGFCDGRL